MVRPVRPFIYLKSIRSSSLYREYLYGREPQNRSDHRPGRTNPYKITDLREIEVGPEAGPGRAQRPGSIFLPLKTTFLGRKIDDPWAVLCAPSISLTPP